MSSSSAGAGLHDPLARELIVRTGPRRAWYAGPALLFVGCLFAFFVVGFSVQTDRDDAASTFQRSDGGALRVTVAQRGTWDVWLETSAGVERSDELSAALDRGSIGVGVTRGRGGKQLETLPPAGGSYRAALPDGDLVGTAVAELDLRPGTYRVSVPAAADPPEEAIAGFAVGPVPTTPSPLVPVVAGAGALAAVLWGIWLRLRRRRARTRLSTDVHGG